MSGQSNQENFQIRADFKINQQIEFPTNEFDKNGIPMHRDVKAELLTRGSHPLGSMMVRYDFIESVEKIKAYT